MSILPLPIDACVRVASYMPSAALLAVALTPAGNGGEMSPASRAIVSSLVHDGGLDFVNVGRTDQLATLTEQHLCAMLSYLDVAPTMTDLLPIVVRAADLLHRAKNGARNVDAGALDVVSLSLKNGGLSLDIGIESGSPTAVTDDDVKAVLLLVNARKCLGRFRLDHCGSVEGGGLGPLCGSARLEQIDLGVNIFRSPDPMDAQRTVWGQPMLSYEVVFPILESIAVAKGGALKYVHLSDHRIGYRKAYPGIQPFTQRYNQVLGSRKLTCANCNNALGVEDPLFADEGKQYGTCYTCLQFFCRRSSCRVRQCIRGGCKRGYCTQCLPESPNDDYFDVAGEEGDFGEFLDVLRPRQCGGCLRGGAVAMVAVPPQQRVPITHDQAEAGCTQLFRMMGYSEVEAKEMAKEGREKAEATLKKEAEERARGMWAYRPAF